MIGSFLNQRYGGRPEAEQALASNQPYQSVDNYLPKVHQGGDPPEGKPAIKPDPSGWLLYRSTSYASTVKVFDRTFWSFFEGSLVFS